MKKTDIYADFHVHTHLSPCGTPAATARALLDRASAKGFAGIGFADHVTPQPVPGCAFYDTQRIDTVAKLRQELAGLEKAPSLPVMVGIEADYTLAGPACLDDAVLRECDHVIGAASHFHLPAAPQPADESPRAKAELMLRMAREMLVIPGISVWAHPFDCSKMRPLGPILAAMAEQELAGLVILANQHHVAVEINGGAGLQQEYREVTAPFFKLARELNAQFTLTSDAHHPDDLDRLDLAISWAQQMGFQPRDFLTPPEFQARQQHKIAVYFSNKPQSSQ